MSDVHQPKGPADPNPQPRWTGGAIALVLIGLLILIPSGLCTAVFGLGDLMDSGGPFMLIIALVVGGPFVVLGALLIRTGLRERRQG